PDARCALRAGEGVLDSTSRPTEGAARIRASGFGGRSRRGVRNAGQALRSASRWHTGAPVRAAEPRMRHFRRVHLFGLITLGLAGFAWAVGTPLKPLQGDYQVLRDGKEVGHATLALRETGGDTWEYSNETKGTKGMASLLGLDVVEKSTFRWRDGKAEGLHY